MTAEASARSVAAGLRGIEAAGATDSGTVREENQDVWDAQLVGDTVTLLIADGMGGHAGGRESAEAAVQAARAHLQEPGPPRETLEGAVHDANAAVAGVRDLIGGDPGTTLVLAIVGSDRAYIANVGDSRAYLVRSGEAQAVTDDHSWVGEETRAGRLSSAEGRHHPRRNIITRAVMGLPVAPDLFEISVQRGDTIVLCTDGVWEPLSDAQIAELVTDAGPLVRDLERLCEAALDAGGRDNVTAVAARIA